MKGKIPRVSIGLAVYNGEEFLEAAIQSILAQTFTDFELIISDNASTDRTAEISRRYAAGDDRVRYSRNETNIGGANNENKTFHLARGEYFRWAAHDDLLAPRLLEKLVQVLDEDPTVVLCHSLVTEINERGEVIRRVRREDSGSAKPHERFRYMANIRHNCLESYGLVRSSVLRQTDLQLNYTDSDRTLLAELSLYGRFHLVDEPLFFKRIHPKMSVLVFQDWRDRMAWFDPRLKRSQVTFPNWQQLTHYLRIIRKAPLDARERFLCYAYMLGWLFLERHARMIGKDLWVAARKTLGLARAFES